MTPYADTPFWQRAAWTSKPYEYVSASVTTPSIPDRYFPLQKLLSFFYGSVAKHADSRISFPTVRRLMP